MSPGTLAEREICAVVMRFGFSTGKPETFNGIGRELGANRVRAHAIFRNAIQWLGSAGKRRSAHWPDSSRT